MSTNEIRARHVLIANRVEALLEGWKDIDRLSARNRAGVLRMEQTLSAFETRLAELESFLRERSI
jgi:hypothetical protein